LMFFNQNLSADPLEIGAKIPAIQATVDSGEAIELSGLVDEEYVLVFFYPKANTPGCTKQACSLRDAYEVLMGKGVSVFGVSKDSVNAQSSFKQKYKLPFSLIADTQSKVINGFGVPKKLGFASRQAFLFKKGSLVWRDLAASTAKQADDVLTFLEESE